MGELFSALTDAMAAQPAIAMSAAFIWGVLSIVLSPCHLASIPLIIAYLSGNKNQTPERAALTSSLFALGIFISIAIIGGISVAMGRLMGDIGTAGGYIVAALFIIFGLHLMDVIPIPIKGLSLSSDRKRGLFPAFVIGLTAGLALGPCTFAFMAPVLAAVFKTSGTAPAYATILLLLFAIGHSLVIIVAGSSITLVQRLLRLNENSGTLTWFRRICGLIVVLAGLYLIAST